MATAICEVWTYDVWGNATNGFEVNDRHCVGRDIHVQANKESGLSDQEIQALFGVKCKLDIDGDDTTYYVNRARDSYPIGEIHIIEWQ